MLKLQKIFENVEFQGVELKQESNDLPSKVLVDSGLNFDSDLKKISQEFLDFVADNLSLKEYPKIHLLSQRHQGMTYGVFDPNNDEIKVYAKDRGFADILRTAAHELTHYWQKVEGRIPSDLKGRDHKLESEANTKAGDLIYMFGLKNPQIYEMGIKSDIIEKPKD